MSDLSDAEVHQSLRRGARNGVIFGSVTVVVGVTSIVVSRTHLWAPLGPYRPVPQVLVYGVLLAIGLATVTMSIVRLVALRQSPTESEAGGEEPPTY
jgi:hypothetical protein